MKGQEMDILKKYGIEIDELSDDLKLNLKTMLEELISKNHNIINTQELSIHPYDFVKLKNGDYVFVRVIKNRRIKNNIYLDEKIVDGVLISKNNIITTGISTKNKLNIKTSSFKQSVYFMNSIQANTDFSCSVDLIDEHISKR